MKTETKAALGVALIGMIACNAPVSGLVPITRTPAIISPAPTLQPSPTVLPTASSMDSAHGSAVLLATSHLEVTAVAVMPTGPDAAIYAATWGQGVYRSRDHGLSWTQIAAGPAQVTSLAISTDATPLILAGTANMGVARLSDAGNLGSFTSIGLSDVIVRSVGLDPVRKGRLLAGTDGGPYQSLDGGATWQPLGLGGEQVDDIVVDDVGGRLYAATASHGIQMTSDDGVSWVDFSLPTSGVNDLLSQPFSPPALYAATEGRGVARIMIDGAQAPGTEQGQGPGLAAPSGGEQQPGTAVTGGPYGGTVTDLKMDPANPKTLYAATEYGVFKTTDNGDNWRLTSLSSTDVYALAIDPANSAVVYAGTRGEGFFRSLDGGETWAKSDDPLVEDLIIYSLVVDPSSPNTVYAGGRRANVDGFTSGDWGGGVFKSIDAGMSWTAVSEGLPEGWVYSLAVDPSKPGILYAGTHSMGVYKSLDGGVTWQSKSEGLVSRYHLSPDDLKIRSLAINPRNPDELIVGTWGGGSVFESQDGGDTWEYAGKGAEPTHVRSVAYNSVLPDVIYAGKREGGLIYKQMPSADSEWQSFPDQVHGGWQDFSVVLSIVISPANGRTMFIAVEGAGVLRSLDGGVSWKIVDDGLLAAPVSAIGADANQPAHLFATTYGAGVFQSLDGGMSWSQHLWATPWDWGLGMAVDSQGGRLLVATQSNGLQVVPFDGPTSDP